MANSSLLRLVRLSRQAIFHTQGSKKKSFDLMMTKDPSKIFEIFG